MSHAHHNPKSNRDELTRREMLRAGSLGLAGAGLSGLHEAQAADPRVRTFGKAKRCILLYLFGAASQLETFDVKPDAPVEVRGELQSIATSVPGVRFGELLPRTAKLADRLTVIRSTTHPYPIHGSAYTLTSTPTLDIPMQLNARDSRHWPFIGSAVDYLDQQMADGRALGSGLNDGVPRNIALPWPLSTRRPHPSRNGGPYGAFLGKSFDPVWTEFEGTALHEASYEFGGKVTTVKDPYGGVEPDCRFPLSAGRDAKVSSAVVTRRRDLLQQLNAANATDKTQSAARQLQHFQKLAYSLLASKKTAEALDVQRESATTRERYGMTLFGQSCLAARRLIEAGSRFATVFWDEFGSVNAAWDTHIQHYPRMKEQLLPGFDMAFGSLIADLETRGLLDETLVVCVTEHGRTPKLRNGRGGGRDHWSNAYSSVMAGGGSAAGKVVGRTDRIAGEVVDVPVSPKDILATMYHLLGIDPHATVYDRIGRPMAVAGPGRVRRELLA